MEGVEKLCNLVVTLGELNYLGDMLSAGGGCEAAMTVRINVWVC